MQSLFNQIIAMGNDKSALSTTACGIDSVCTLSGEESAKYRSELAGVDPEHMPDNGACGFVGGEAYYNGEAWLLDIAYKALSNWKYNKPKYSSPTFGTNSGLSAPAAPAAQKHSEEIVRLSKSINAMVAAAESDGHIDKTERRRILKAMAEMEIPAETKGAFAELLEQPITVDKLACGTEDIELKAEIYLASCITLSWDHQSGRAYLDQLESKLELPVGLAQMLQWHAQRVVARDA